jgi:hypothetical protein
MQKDTTYINKDTGESIVIDWSKQHPGIHRGLWRDVTVLMPEVAELIKNTFPDSSTWSDLGKPALKFYYERQDFIWDIKVMMLMPGQWPCIPNWHYDFIPRDSEGKQDFSKVDPDWCMNMWMWISGPPLTIFRFYPKAGISPIRTKQVVQPETWYPFTQLDEHQGQPATEHGWRAFIRAIPPGLVLPSDTPLRRHSQVYLDAKNFKW